MYHGLSHRGDDEDEPEPLKSRHSCTDFPCCVFFVICTLLFGGLYASILLQTKGSMGRLFHGIDYQGQVCGVDSNVTDKPFLFWCVGTKLQSSGSSPVTLTLGRRVCVASCPGGLGDQMQECSGTSADTVDSYPTQVVLNRYCVPDPRDYRDAAQLAIGSQLGGADERMAEVVSSIPSAWPALIGALLLATVLGYLHLFLLQWCAEVLLWISILISIAGFAGLGGYLWLNAGSATLTHRLPEALQTQLPTGVSNASPTDEEHVYRGVATLCWAVSAALICLACCLRSSISAAAACVEVACEAIFEMPSLLLAPATKAVVKGVLAVVFIYGFVLLWSIGPPKGFEELPVVANVTDVAPHISHDQKQYGLILFYMLVAYWILAFVGAVYQFVVAYAVATYYYAPFEKDDAGKHSDEKDVEGCCVALEGFHVGMLYHAGSLAFGALLIAILHVIQKVIEYAQLKNKESGDNQVVSCILFLCSCCVACLKEIVGFINRNAYIDMAITSNSFCTAARRALQMVIEIGGAMAILNGATYIFAIFGTVFITVTCTACTYLAAGFGPFADQSSTLYVADPLAAAIVGACVALPVSLSFMDVFDMTSDTLLYCYGVDLQSGKEDHNAPQALQELVDHHSGDHD